MPARVHPAVEESGWTPTQEPHLARLRVGALALPMMLRRVLGAPADADFLSVWRDTNVARFSRVRALATATLSGSLGHSGMRDPRSQPLTYGLGDEGVAEEEELEDPKCATDEEAQGNEVLPATPGESLRPRPPC